jgi:hypothetical protein
MYSSKLYYILNNHINFHMAAQPAKSFFILPDDVTFAAAEKQQKRTAYDIFCNMLKALVCDDWETVSRLVELRERFLCGQTKAEIETEPILISEKFSSKFERLVDKHVFADLPERLQMEIVWNSKLRFKLVGLIADYIEQLPSPFITIW